MLKGVENIMQLICGEKMKTLKGPAISENGTSSLPADAPGSQDTNQDQWDKSGETP